MKPVFPPKIFFGFNSKKTCYYCGAAAPSNAEHVPPKMMFAAYDNSSITVPSCEGHNNDKSGEDEKIIFSLLMIVEAGILDFPDDPILNENVILEYARLKALFDKAKSLASRDNLWAEQDEDLRGEAAIIKSVEVVEAWVRQITAGLVWSVTGAYDANVNWAEATVYNPIYYPLALTEEEIVAQSVEAAAQHQALNALAWRTGWSAQGKSYPPDIYRFAVSFDSFSAWPEANVIFKHSFYNGSAEWFVAFTAPEAMIQAIQRGLSSYRAKAVATRKPLPEAAKSAAILQVQKSRGQAGWNRFPEVFVQELKQRLGDDLGVLNRAARKYRLFEQPFFQRPAQAFGDHEATMLGVLVGSLGNQLAMRNMLADAEQLFKLSLRLMPNNNPSHSSLVALYTQQGNPEKAVRHEQEAAKVFEDLFDVAQGPELEQRLIVGMIGGFESMGASQEEAENLATQLLKQSKEALVKEGLEKMMYASVLGDYLYVNEADDEALHEFMEARRNLGVPDEETRRWHNLSLLEQKVMLMQDTMLDISQLRILKDQGKSDEDAITVVKASNSTYTDDPVSIDPSDPDAPLPVELKLVVNDYRNAQLITNPEALQQELEAASSFNAWIRQKLASKALFDPPKP